MTVISGLFVGPVVLDKCVKLRDPSLNCSQEIPPQAIGGSIFDCFSPITSDQKQIMTLYPVWLLTMSVWMSVENLVILHIKCAKKLKCTTESNDAIDTE